LKPMPMTVLDWAIVAGYGLFALAVGAIYSRRAGRSTNEYFISSRNLPWWIIGTSMVATTFAADTPLAVSGIVAKDGIAGNWLWWNLALAHLLAVFFFSRLWRRAGIITDLELIELRYSGRPAAALRGFRALYEGVLTNGIIMGWVLLAMAKLLGVLFDFPKIWALGLCLVLALAYTVLSGFWGVVVTDLVQFAIAMVGAIALAIIAVGDHGGLSEVVSGIEPETLALFPRHGGELWTAFLVYLGINWWASKHVDGGGYLSQRMFAARSERDSQLGTLWFAVAHYALRPWPWILVGLVALKAHGGEDWFSGNAALGIKGDPELGYAQMIKDCLPVGLRGLMVASFFAAFMSTIDTHLNWGGSYLVNDLYRRFLARDREERHYVLAARVCAVLLMLVGVGVALLMETIAGGWKLMWQLTAGIGGVYVLRWFWWRINAWSEIAAWTASSIATLVLNLGFPEMDFGPRLSITALFSTGCWLIVTLLTAPVAEERLVEFYRRVRPRSPGWRPIAERAGLVADRSGIGGDLLGWALGTAVVFGALFGIGKLLLGEPMLGALGLGAAAAGGICIWRLLRDQEPAR